MYLSRLEEPLTQIELRGNTKAEGDFSSNLGEKGL
jgi:hypothetical protein